MSRECPSNRERPWYLLDRNPNDDPSTQMPIVENAPLHVIQLTNATPKFPIWNTNATTPGANDITSITSALHPTQGAMPQVVVQATSGPLNPDGIMAVFPTDASAPAGTPLTVLYVQKIVDGDETGPTALPASQQCNKAPFSDKTNHDISNVRLATTTDGVHFTELGIVQGLNDPAVVEGRDAEMPVASNGDDDGREKNRRVEAWLLPSK